MSFPPEVSMIPSFLLLRSFPLGLLLCGSGAGALLYLILRRLLPAWGHGWRGLAQLAIALLFGRIVALPICRLLGIPPSVTLLNTYAALVLPGMAAGFSIFLLKGFFDGLPRELYDAASIDGASEIQMFRVITYPLAKPIIVVTVMGQVLSAYGSFMWAFVVCQDRNMWTLMVWLYAFQSQYAVGQLNLIMAALTLASVPTFLFFLFCQRIILRGIILPSMK
jgi:ABC-type glycerol-3-phosphate transport system permease component